MVCSSSQVTTARLGAGLKFELSLGWEQGQIIYLQQAAQTPPLKLQAKLTPMRLSAIASPLPCGRGAYDKKQPCARIGANEYPHARQVMQTPPGG